MPEERYRLTYKCDNGKRYTYILRADSPQHARNRLVKLSDRGRTKGCTEFTIEATEKVK